MTIILLFVDVIWLGSLAVFARNRQGSWLGPGGLVSVYWLFAIALPLLFFDGAEVSFSAVVYLSTAVTAWVIGTLIGIPSPPRACSTSPKFPSPFVGSTPAIFGVAGMLAGVAAAAASASATGANLTSLVSVSSLLQTGSDQAALRYGGGTAQNSTASALIALNFLGALTAPFASRSETRWHRQSALMPVLGTLVYSTLTTARAPLLIAAIMTLGGYLAFSLNTTGKFPAISAKQIGRFAFAGAAITLAFVGIAIIRIGQYSSQVQHIVAQKAQVYAFGYLPGFSAWISNPDAVSNNPIPLGYGTSSLAGVNYLTGQSRTSTRTYGQFVVIDTSGQKSNIFTGLQNLIVDFSMPGALAILATSGFLFARVYKNAITRRSAIACMTYACVFTVVCFSQTIIATSFTNVVVAFGAALILTRSRNCKSTARLRPRRQAIS